MRNAKPFVMSAIATLLLSAAAANATIMTATYSGLLKSGNDYTGIFLPAGSNLAGQAYVATFIYDTSKGTRFQTATSDSIFAAGGANPVIDSFITINGTTMHVSGNYDGYLQTDKTYTTFHRAEDRSIVNNVKYSNVIYFQPANLSASFSLDRSVTLSNFFPYFHNTGFFNFTSYQLPSNAIVQNVDGLFADSGTYTVTGGVPEPTSWALLITGFGLTGAVLRRRRASAFA
jgi:hypothetical protein